jgi:hypothetical protein
MPKLRAACGRASQKIVKLSKVGALKRMMGYTTNVKDAITNLAKTVRPGGHCWLRHMTPYIPLNGGSKCVG